MFPAREIVGREIFLRTVLWGHKEETSVTARLGAWPRIVSRNRMPGLRQLTQSTRICLIWLPARESKAREACQSSRFCVERPRQDASGGQLHIRDRVLSCQVALFRSKRQFGILFRAKPAVGLILGCRILVNEPKGAIVANRRYIFTIAAAY